MLPNVRCDTGLSVLCGLISLQAHFYCHTDISVDNELRDVNKMRLAVAVAKLSHAFHIYTHKDSELHYM